MAPANASTVRIATQEDIAHYVEMAREAQAFVRSKGLTQWVPAAHDAFLPGIKAKVERRSLHKVSHGNRDVAFFDYSFDANEWWSGRTGMAAYISGIVVGRASRGLGVGAFILDCAEVKTRDGGADYLRLDCHAENVWLCEYYRSKGFIEVARIEQHPGYIGALHQKRVSGRTTESAGSCTRKWIGETVYR